VQRAPTETAEQFYSSPLGEELRSLPESKRDYIRKRAKSDLAFLAFAILGYKDVNPKTHAALCRFMTHDPMLRRMALMPRGHLKSTICTIADSIRYALIDPEETRILIVNETATNAEGFLSEIKAHFVHGETLRFFFPHVIPEKLVGPGSQWGASAASVRRKSAYKETTFSAIGVGGAVTSRHYTHIKCDDLIGLEANRSPAVMDAAKRWVANIDPLVTDINRDRIDFIGTRWSRHDLYAHVMSTYGDRMHVFRRRDIENNEVIFPQKYNLDFLNNLRVKEPLVYFAQYANDPISGGVTDFPSARSFAFDNNGSVVFHDGAQTRKWPMDALDRVICVDVSLGGSASSDFSAIEVVGMAPDENCFVLSSRSARWSPSELVDEIFNDVKRWRPRIVGIEKAGQTSTEHYFRMKMRQEQYFVNVVPLNPENKEKTARIRAGLDPVLKSGRLFTLASQQVLNHQINNFPDLQYFDEIDALAYFPRIAVAPLRQEDLDEDNEVEAKILELRGISGYGI
jgi:hypothetical protein